MLAALRSSTRSTRLASAATLSLLVACGAALARQDAKPAPQEARTIFAFEHASCDEFLTSPKDAALLAAIKLIPVRITEIMNTPGLGPNKDEVPEGIVELVHRVVTGPMRIAVTQNGIDENSKAPKLGMVMSYAAADEADARLMMQRVENVRKKAGDLGDRVKPSQRYAGMNAVVLPPGTLLYGPRKAADGWRFEVIFGVVPDPDGAAMWAALPKGEAGKAPAARGVLDLAAASPIAEMLGGMASMWMPDSGEFMKSLREAGVVGPDAMQVEAVWSSESSGTRSVMTVRRAARFADKLGLVKQTITPADLAVIPADSVFASITKVDPQGSWQRLNGQLGQQPELAQFLQHINTELGIDLEKDFIAALGNTTALCISDTTGGNSLFSGVGFVEIKDPARLTTALDKVADLANRKIAEEISRGGPNPGTVKITNWTPDSGPAKGVRFTSIRTPGLPIPIEPTLAMSDRWLIVGLSPQSCAAAAGHAVSVKSDSKGGLSSNPAFAAAGASATNAVSVTFIDSAATLRDGYPMLQLLGTALTNFARSPDSSSPREVAQVVPTLAELKAGVRPMIWTTAWSGDDLVITGHADQSTLVNLAALAGTGDIGSIVFGSFIGGAIGHKAGEDQGRAQAEWEHAEHKDHDDADEPEMDEAPEAPEPPEAPAAPQASGNPA